MGNPRSNTDGGDLRQSISRFDILYSQSAHPGRDHGQSVRPNVRLSAGSSNQASANNQPGDDLDFGDYQGVAFHAGRFMPVWADNSNSTGNNPNGAAGLDLYVVAVTVN